MKPVQKACGLSKIAWLSQHGIWENSISLNLTFLRSMDKTVQEFRNQNRIEQRQKICRELDSSYRSILPFNGQELSLS